MRKRTSAVLHINRLETHPESPMELCVSAHQMSNKRGFLLFEFAPGSWRKGIVNASRHWLPRIQIKMSRWGMEMELERAGSQMSWHKSSPLAKYWSASADVLGVAVLDPGIQEVSWQRLFVALPLLTICQVPLNIKVGFSREAGTGECRWCLPLAFSMHANPPEQSICFYWIFPS